MMLVLLSVLRAAARPRVLAVPAFALLLLAGACAEKGTKIPAGTSKPDQFLFERGNKSLEEKKWFTAREFFQTLIDTYPQSPHRADAKLGLGDAYLGDGSPASQVLAINEYREFLSFFPTSARADYAQFKLAMCHFSQMAKAGRDQTETLEALKEFDILFEKYPNSPLLTEARAKQREAKDRLGRSEYLVGLTYYRLKWYPGVVARLQALLKSDPQFTDRDAVYFYLADALVELNRTAEAVPLLEKIPQEFEKSDYIEKAKKRLEEVKNAAATALPAPVKQTPPKETPRAEGDAAEGDAAEADAAEGDAAEADAAEVVADPASGIGWSRVGLVGGIARRDGAPRDHRGERLVVLDRRPQRQAEDHPHRAKAEQAQPAARLPRQIGRQHQRQDGDHLGHHLELAEAARRASPARGCGPRRAGP